jgi:hypothetical protein
MSSLRSGRQAIASNKDMLAREGLEPRRPPFQFFEPKPFFNQQLNSSKVAPLL